MAPAVVFVAIVFLVPVAVILWYALHKFAYGSPLPGVTLANFVRIFSNPTYFLTLLRSAIFVSGVSVLVVAIAFPFAYFVALRVPPRRRNLYIVVATIPFLTSYLARVIAWLNLFGAKGIINSFLIGSGFISEPLAIFMPGRPAVVITFVYLLAPLAFLTLYGSLERIDPHLIEAAGDLGARRRHIFLRVILPGARNGVLAGLAFVFIALFGDYITPVMIGGTDGVLFVNLLVNQFGASMQWGFGAAMALTMLVTTGALLGALKLLIGRSRTGDYSGRFIPVRSPWLRAYAGLFVLFLYAPIVLLMLFALNASPIVGLPFTGVTLDWFKLALDDPAFLRALATSLKVATASAVAATALGALAAVPLARRTGIARNAALLLLSAPMLLPPVVLGIGILIGMQVRTRRGR